MSTVKHQDGQRAVDQIHSLAIIPPTQQAQRRVATRTQQRLIRLGLQPKEARSALEG